MQLRSSALTGQLLFGGILGACLADVVLYVVKGNSSTFSWTLLSIQADHPLFGGMIMYTVTTLVGHLTLPVFKPEPTLFRKWLGITIGLSPIAASIGYIGLHPSGSPYATQQLQQWLAPNRGIYFGVQVIFGILGLLNGMTNVPQHVYEDAKSSK